MRNIIIVILESINNQLRAAQDTAYDFKSYKDRHISLDMNIDIIKENIENYQKMLDHGLEIEE